MGVGGQRHPLAYRPSTHCTREGVGPTAGREGCRQYDPHRKSIREQYRPWRVAIPTELSRATPQLYTVKRNWITVPNASKWRVVRHSRMSCKTSCRHFLACFKITRLTANFLLHLPGFSLPAAIVSRATEGAAASATFVFTKIRSTVGAMRCGGGTGLANGSKSLLAPALSVLQGRKVPDEIWFFFLLWHKSPTAP